MAREQRVSGGFLVDTPWFLIRLVSGFHFFPEFLMRDATLLDLPTGKDLRFDITRRLYINLHHIIV
jgi:hypothetical protein